MNKNYNRNPLGSNQWTLKKDTEKLRKIILNIQSETENDDFGWITALDV